MSGGLLGGLGVGLAGNSGWGQQQYLYQNAYMTTGTATTSGLLYLGTPVVAAAEKDPSPESALAWLDRRVNEVRVKL